MDVAVCTCVREVCVYRRNKRNMSDDVTRAMTFKMSSSSALGSRSVSWVGEGISVPSPSYPVLCCPLPYRVVPVFVHVVSPSLGWSPLSSFLVILSPCGDMRGPPVVYETVDMPYPGPFHYVHSVYYIHEFCPLPDPDVGISILVCDVEHNSFNFSLCARKVVLCFRGSAPYVIAGSTQELYTYVSSDRWQGCFWRYPGVWRMPPSLPWFFVVSICPGSFPWGCSVVPSTRSLQHFLSAHCSRLLGCCLQPPPLCLRSSS